MSQSSLSPEIQPKLFWNPWGACLGDEQGLRYFPRQLLPHVSNPRKDHFSHRFTHSQILSFLDNFAQDYKAHGVTSSCKATICWEVCEVLSETSSCGTGFERRVSSHVKGSGHKVGTCASAWTPNLTPQVFKSHCGEWSCCSLPKRSFSVLDFTFPHVFELISEEGHCCILLHACCTTREPLVVELWLFFCFIDVV